MYTHACAQGSRSPLKRPLLSERDCTLTMRAVRERERLTYDPGSDVGEVQSCTSAASTGGGGRGGERSHGGYIYPEVYTGSGRRGVTEGTYTLNFTLVLGEEASWRVHIP